MMCSINMKNKTLLDSFLSIQEKTRSEIVEFFGFLFECTEDFTFELYMGKEI
jgi:hypothetical protein